MTVLGASSVVLGDYVQENRYGRRGRITQIHFQCPQGAAWQMGQEIPLTDEEINSRWVSILVDGGGAMVTPMTDCEIVEPFDFTNLWEDFYFRVDQG